MISNLFFFQGFFSKPYEEKVKIGVLGISVFVIMGAYTIFKELKDSVFMIIVGARYLPNVKTLSLFLMIPLVMIYGVLSQRYSRGKLLAFYLIFYGLLGVISAFFIKDPVFGLYNTVASPGRLFGWFFYLFLEGSSPFLVSGVWSFLNSISYPEDVKNNYIGMTCMSKLGGIVFSGIAYLYNTFFYIPNLKAEVTQYFYMTLISSFLMILIAFFIIFLILVVPEKNLTGYSSQITITEVSEKEKIDPQIELKTERKSFFGLFHVITNPYILGIFGLTFFWEVVNVIFNNLRLNIAFAEAGSICEITAILYKNIFFMHLFGLFFVLFGTKNIIKMLGLQAALVSIPLLTGMMVFLFLLFPSSNMIFFVYLIIRAINYTLTFPIKEALFIPTSREIQFKTKSWIDSFGQKLSKGFGAGYNKLIQYIPLQSVGIFQVLFFSVLIFLWILSDFFLGRKWEKIIKEKKIIT
jgi:AAA family ATP:ADP antiporter